MSTVVLLVLVALTGLVLNLEARNVRAALVSVAEALRSPSEVSAKQYRQLKERVKILERLRSQSLEEMLQAAVDAERERERITQTVSRALKRIEKGEDGESAIEAEAVALGIGYAEEGTEEGVQPLHPQLDLHGEGGRQLAQAAKWGA